MKYYFCCLITLFFLFVVLALPAHAQSSLFTFEKIVDTDTLMPGRTDTFGDFGDPALDGSHLFFKGGSGNEGHGHMGLYDVSGGTFNVIAEEGTPVPGGSGTNFTRLNGFIVSNKELFVSGGNVAFVGEGMSVSGPTIITEGIYTNIGGSLNIVVDLNTPMPNSTGNFGAYYFEVPAIDGENVAFSGGNSTQEGIYTMIGGTLQVVADLNTQRPGTTGNFDNLANTTITPSLLDIEGSDVVFGLMNTSASEQRGIYTTLGGSLRVVADFNTPVPGQTALFDGFGAIPQINGGNIVFSGSGAFFIDNTKYTGMFLYRDGQISVLVDNDTQIPDPPPELTYDTFLGTNYANRSLDEQGNFAFVAGLTFSESGLYTNIGGTLIKVLDYTDMLDGKAPKYYSLSRRSLRGNDLAFAVTFTDSSKAIYVAHYSPPTLEPDINISATSYDFGNVNIGNTSTQQTFTISNTGIADLILGTIGLTGADASEFGFQNDICSAQILAPSGTCTLDVTFSPTSEGAKSANLSIPSNDPDTPVLNVQLSGTGIDPNAVDDDGDGYTEYEGDCDDNDPDINPDACDIKGDGIDQDCKDGDRTTGKPCPDSGGGGNKETNCTDGIDNDSDGLIDCEDRDCRKDPACS